MLPPHEMLAKNNLAQGFLAILLALLAFGCTPAGPQALLTGRQLLESGNAAGAVEKLKLATSLMSSNAQAWNYLGLAAHQAGQPAESLAAYQQAIKLNRDFVEARFNLGCLLADQGKTGPARDAFTACTVLRPAYTEAWLRRARCELQLHEPVAAESSLKEVLRQSPQNAEALNTLGLVQLQRNKPRDAAQSFSAALKAQPDHRAALLNLAITTHQQLNERPAALVLYRQYLALTPRPADWDAVNALAQSLQPAAPIPVQTKPLEAVTQPSPSPVRSAEVVQRPPTNAKPEPVVIAPASKPTPSPPVTNPPTEVVRLPPEPVIHTTPVDNNQGIAKVRPEPVTNQTPTNSASGTSTDKRGFLTRVNPANLFHKDAKPAPHLTPLPPEAEEKLTVPDSGNDPAMIGGSPSVSSSNTGSFPRYTYLSPARPATGNRSEGERLLAQGRREQDSRKFTEAVQSYRAAVASDPGNFDALFALGFTSYQVRSYKLSTWAWEHALAIHPDSVDARYNFALALRALDFVPDAANELEKVLRADGNLTKAHLTLGSIYAEQLKDAAKARVHFRRVLDLEPSHPRGGDIRQWLVNNKP